MRVDVEPIPYIPEHTKMFDAGAISFGVEYRVLNNELVEANYGAEVTQELQESYRPEDSAQIDDSGVSIHVFGSDGREYLRFDCFEEGPHYHYLLPDETFQRVVMFDPVANGDPLTWTMSCLRQRLPAMLREAGGKSSAARLDARLVERVLDEVEREARGISPS
jgi:hypothetical protein